VSDFCIVTAFWGRDFAGSSCITHSFNKTIEEGFLMFYSGIIVLLLLGGVIGEAECCMSWIGRLIDVQDVVEDKIFLFYVTGCK